MTKNTFKTNPIFSKDEIIQEVWRIKDEIGAEYQGDVKRFFADMRKREVNLGHKTVSFESHELETSSK